MPNITSITSQKILDSRGQWTIRVTVKLSSGTIVHASVPQGKSTGAHEVVSIPAEKAVEHIAEIIAPELEGVDPTDQNTVDEALLDLDNTPDKSNLGANAMLGVSLACARAAAASKEVPLWQHLRNLVGKKGSPNTLPRLYMNVINGGLHAGNNLDIQEYMIIPKTNTFAEAAEFASHFYAALRSRLSETYGPISTLLGDEGGFAPYLQDNLTPLQELSEMAERLDIRDKLDLGIDAAANDIDKKPEELEALYRTMIDEFGLYYLEDPFEEEEFELFAKLRKACGDSAVITGDDLTTTNLSRMETAHKKGSIGGIIIKYNQIGTLTETLEAIAVAQEWEWKVVVSHRSGETNDSFIADLAYAVEADGIKLGAPARGERVAKYNRLLEIEQNNN